MACLSIMHLAFLTSVCSVVRVFCFFLVIKPKAISSKKKKKSNDKRQCILKKANILCVK